MDSSRGNAHEQARANTKAAGGKTRDDGRRVVLQKWCRGKNRRLNEGQDERKRREKREQDELARAPCGLTIAAG